MRFLFILLLTVVALFESVGFAGVKARVVSKNGDPLPGSTCVIFALPDTVFTDCVEADGDGFFDLKEPDSDWYIDISCEGYYSSILKKKNYYELSNSVHSSSASSDDSKLEDPFVNISLTPLLTQLDEVVVKSSKRDLSVKNGIVSYNNLNEIIETCVVTSAHDLLTSLPLISSTDGNNLSISGSPFGSVVYINGKQSQMDSADLMDYLKNIPAEQVENVEIIYTPTPRWKTRMSVINVKLKRQKEYTVNGQVVANASRKHTYSGRLGATVFAGLPKLNFSLGYNFGSSKSVEKETSYGRHTVGTTLYEVMDTTTLRSLTNTHNVYVGVDYQINNSNLMNITYNGFFSPKQDGRSISANSIYGDYTSAKAAKRDYNAVSLSYSGIKGVEAGVDYTNFYNTSNQEIYYDNNGASSVALSGVSKQRVNRIKGYVDFSTPLPSDWRLLYGASYEYSHNVNRIHNISNVSDMSSDENISKISEKLAVAYVGAQKSLWGNKLSFNASVKGEIYEIADYNANQLLPTAVVTFIPTYTHIFQASYQSYRTFPSLWQRQDYISYTSPYNLSEGNPGLKPTTCNVASLLYLYKQKYSLTLGYYYGSNFSLTQSYQSPNALVLISKPYNINYSSLYDITLNVPWNVGKILFSTISVNAGFEKFKSSDWHNLAFDKHDFTGAVMVDNTVVISQKPKISVNVLGMYKLPSIVGLWERGHAWLLNAGVSGSFMNDNLTVKLYSFDLLKTLYPLSKVRLATQWLDVNSNYYSRYFSIDIAYRFKGYRDRTKKDVDVSRYGIDL